jgi:hypothetical protein
MGWPFHRFCFTPSKLEFGCSSTGVYNHYHGDFYILIKMLNDLYSSPNLIRVIKSRMKWAGHAAHMGKREVHTGFWWGHLSEGDHLGGPGLDGIILKWIFKTWDRAWTGLSWQRIGTGGGRL